MKMPAKFESQFCVVGGGGGDKLVTFRLVSRSTAGGKIVVTFGAVLRVERLFASDCRESTEFNDVSFSFFLTNRGFLPNLIE